MNGIFNYQVPGRSATRPMSRQPQQSSLETPSLDQPVRMPSFEEPVKTEVRSLLQQRLQQINNQTLPNPSLDISLSKLNGSDRGHTFFYPTKPSSPAAVPFGKGDAQPDIPTDWSLELTTKALGEEDGGFPPTMPTPSTAQPLELTTKALGEEDGSYR